MSVVAQVQTVVGILYTQGHEYELLDMKPQKPIHPVPVSLRDLMVAFLVRDDGGYARVLYVSKGDFSIMITPPMDASVLYEVEEVELENTLSLSTSDNVE